MKRLMLFVAGASAAALTLTVAALGATPADQVYGGPGQVGGAGTEGNVAGNVGGTLPFTGLDLLLMVVAAALLVGAGMTIRRVARVKA